MKKIAIIICIIAMLLSGCSNAAPSPQTSIDIDLSQMSSTLVFSELYNILTDVDSYIGMTVKISGTCVIYQDPETGKVYYTCMVTDTAGCCSQGIEFEPQDTTKHPANGDPVTVTGTLSKYFEADIPYITLKSAIIEE